MEERSNGFSLINIVVLSNADAMLSSTAVRVSPLSLFWGVMMLIWPSQQVRSKRVESRLKLIRKNQDVGFQPFR